MHETKCRGPRDTYVVKISALYDPWRSRKCRNTKIVKRRKGTTRSFIVSILEFLSVSLFELILQFGGSVAQRLSGSVVQWFSGYAVQWLSGSLALWHSDSVFVCAGPTGLLQAFISDCRKINKISYRLKLLIIIKKYYVDEGDGEITVDALRLGTSLNSC